MYEQNENFASDTLLTLFPSTFARILAHDVERNINGLLEYADNGCQEKKDNTYPRLIRSIIRNFRSRFDI